MNSRHCPYCHYTKIIKFGEVRGRQRYYCKQCHRTWINHRQRQRRDDMIWEDYVRGNFNLSALVIKYKLSSRTIAKILKRHQIKPIEPKRPCDVIIMDVTYFGRKWGVLVALNAHTGEALYCKKVSGYERVVDYETALYTLRRKGIDPKVCIIDGKIGVREMLIGEGILVQICQFHQIQTIIQCVTLNPELQQNIELLDIARLLTHTNEYDFAVSIAGWKIRNSTWVNERTYYMEGSSRKWGYTHRNSRRAINSLQNNHQYLFTYERYPELHIPKTSAMIEGKFGNIKDKLRLHHGCSDEMKMKIFQDLLMNGTKKSSKNKY